MKRVVVVIGAGPCGLAALKEMREAGHEATIFEREGELGGLFATAAVYPNLHLTISNWAMAFSDFPDPTRLCYPSAEEYLRYLQGYARHFDLERHIHYHSEIRSASLGDDGRWSLQVRQSKGSTDSMLDVQADALIVATGASQLPNSLPLGLEGFGGRVIHSSTYDDAFKQQVAEKKLKVLVVGAGESGADIAAELGEQSPGNNVTVWLRRPPCVGPRYLNAVDEMWQVRANKTTDFPANGFLEAATTNRMSAAQNVYAYGLFRRLLWHTPVLNGTLSRLSLAGTAAAFFRTDQATYVTKNQRMCEAIHQRKIDLIVSPSLYAARGGRTIEFTTPDGLQRRRDFDAIVLCTGFRFSFPWLHLDKRDFSPNPRSWFLHCFPPGLGDRLFFVGYARPHQGGIPALAEMLSRYAALLLRGDRTLPDDYAEQARRDRATEREYYSLSPDLHTLVDYNAFLESVARRIGCEPRLPVSCVLLYNLHLLSVLLLVLQLCHLWPASSIPLNLHITCSLWLGTMLGFSLLHHGLLVQWWFYPHWSVWYRQRGPGSKPSLLHATLSRVNIWKSTAITSGFVLLILWSWPTFYLQRLLISPLVFLTPWAGGRGMWRPKLFALHSCPWRVSDLFLP